jgi:hypothetical protein
MFAHVWETQESCGRPIIFIAMRSPMCLNYRDTLSSVQPLYSFIRENRISATAEIIAVELISACTIFKAVWISLLQQIKQYLDIGLEFHNFKQKLQLFSYFFHDMWSAFIWTPYQSNRDGTGLSNLYTYLELITVHEIWRKAEWMYFK